LAAVHASHAHRLAPFRQHRIASVRKRFQSATSRRQAPQHRVGCELQKLIPILVSAFLIFFAISLGMQHVHFCDMRRNRYEVAILRNIKSVKNINYAKETCQRG
jgi:hypothetical protein